MSRGPFTENAHGPAWLQATLRLGVPAAIAVYLVWTLTQNLSADLQALQGTVSTHVIDTRDTLRVLRAICINTAKTEAERANCEGGR